LAAVVLAICAQASLAQTTVTVASFGGLVLDAEAETLFADARNLGAEIRKDRHGGWAGIKAHLLSGAPGWDIVSIGSARCETAAQMGDLLMPIDYSIVRKGDLPADLFQPKYVKMYSFSYGIVYQKAKYGDHPPSSWADFWDVKKFPGRRALEGEGLYALEAALIVDGVPAKDVYTVLRSPGGVDRAFKKLAEVKPDIVVWLSSVGQAMQVVHDGEVDMAIISNGRALALIQDGVNIGFVWNQAFMDYECFMIPKNAANPKLALELINSALDPKNQANFSMKVKYGAANPKAYTIGVITPEVMNWLSSAPQNLDKQILADPKWYASPEADAAYQRFAKFKTE
jgi:putative spermidine/putrescine transport system substrate-binding protein